MINEIAIKNWDNKVVQHPKLIYPQCNDEGDQETILLPCSSGLETQGKHIFLQNY